MKLLNNNQSHDDQTTDESLTHDQTKTAQDEQSLIQQLLQEKQTNTQKTKKIDALNNGSQHSLSATEVATMRYKFFTLALLVFGVIIWTSFVYPAINAYADKRENLNEARVITTQATTNITTAENFTDFASKVESQSTAITSCINEEKQCDDEVGPLLAYANDEEAARKQAQYYLQIGDLSDPKLLVDERSILTNIDLFLLRFGPNNTPQRTNIGDITSVIISDPVAVQGNMYSVNIELVINFPNNQSLINFLNNAENRIIANDTIDLSPILYQIQEVQYDITKYNESQDTTIIMTAYYYQNNDTWTSDSTNE